MKHIILLFSLLLLLVACGASQPTTETADLQTIRLPMGYIPDPQYSPYYVAIDKGYYAEEGLELELDYSSETDGVALVGAGELPFALVGGDQVLLGRAEGLPLVYILEWFQKYPIAVVSKADSGIESPADLVGRKVGLPGFYGANYIGYAGLLSANGLTLADADAQEIGFNQVESLVTDKSEAVVGYMNNEPVQLAQLGEEINVIVVSDYVDMVATGITTNEETIANNPELVERFIRATLRGLSDVLNDPAEAYEISKKFVEGLDDSRTAVLEASLPLWEADTLGETSPASWEQTQAVLLEIGSLDAPLNDLDAAYTNDFIQNAQP